VIANAGISSSTLGDDKRVQTTAKPIFDTNVNGTFNTLFPIIERFRSRKKGQLAIVSSIASFAPVSISVDYHASKVAGRFLGEGLRPLLQIDNVGVSVICPGFVRSRMTTGEDGGRKSNRAGKVGDFMPFFMEAEPAAKIIIEELEHNVGVIIFPSPLYYFTNYNGGGSPIVREVIQGWMTGKETATRKLGLLTK